MSKPKKTPTRRPGGSAAPARARGPAALELASALAIEAAQKAVHCPTPPSAQAVIDAADAGAVETARAEIAARASAAAADDDDYSGATGATNPSDPAGSDQTQNPE